MDETDTWQVSADQQLPFDPLLNCLLALTKLHNRPCSPRALTAGLPLINNQLTPSLFIRAAARADLAANIIKQPLRKISSDQLPVVLLLHNHQACVLTDIQTDGTAKIISAETTEGYTEVKLDELNKNFAGHVIYAKPTYHFDTRTNEPLEPVAKHWFWSDISKAWPNYTEVIVASLLINIFALTTPLFVMNVYNRVVPNSAIETLWVLAIGISIVIGFDFILRNLRSYFVETTGKTIDLQLSNKTFAQLLNLEMASRPTSIGTLANSIHAFESFRDFLTSTTITVLVDLPFVLLFLLVIWIIGGYLVAVPLVLIPLTLLISFAIQKALAPLISDSYRHAAEKDAVLIEALSSIETIKGLRVEGLMQRRWESIIKTSGNLGVKLRGLLNLGFHFAVVAQQASMIAIVIPGVYRIINGEMTTGALIACTMLVSRSLAPITQLAGLITRYQQSKAALNSLDKIMQMPIERPAEKRFIHPPEFKGNIELKDICFTYPNQPIAALNKISFRINAGEKIGIIGKTGSGKSTLIKLLMKFYQPSSGIMLLDGLEMHQYDPADLRFYTGYVPQDILLLHGSIKENILMSAPYVDDNALIRAATIAGVSNFANSHPEGYERQVGERGQNVSSGQRQAIAIARALILDPPFLVFDEFGSSMDDLTTNLIVQQLSQHLAGKTLVVVTHKANVLSLVDRLLVIENGHLIADGPKEQVLKALAEHKIRAHI